MKETIISKITECMFCLFYDSEECDWCKFYQKRINNSKLPKPDFCKIIEVVVREEEPNWFEYMPGWIKKRMRVKCFYDGKWYTGTISGTPAENDRGVDIKTDKIVKGTKKHFLSICVYMCERNPEQWKKLLVKE